MSIEIRKLFSKRNKLFVAIIIFAIGISISTLHDSFAYVTTRAVYPAPDYSTFQPPANGGSADIMPFAHRNPLQILPVGAAGAKKAQQENASPSGLFSSVSEMPTMTPLLRFTGQATALLRSGAPSVPRSIGADAPIQSVA